MMRIPMISAIAAGALALGGCAYGDLGLGYGGYGGYGSPYGYGGYGGYGSYGGISYGSGYGGYGYGSPYYGAGYGYGSPYYGWYNNYYYPGTGYYVYDQYRRPFTMTPIQKAYWSKRSPALSTRSTTTSTTRVKPNWSGFTAKSQQRRDDRQSTRDARRQARDR
jgi:hypothetical protein